MKRIAGFDGMRGIAAVLVVLGHMHVWELYTYNWPYLKQVTLMILGGTAVQLFFVLSGFLITFLLIKEQKKFGKVSLKSFYIRRALRIFPLYYFFLFIVALVCLFVWPVANRHGFVLDALYLYNFVPRGWYDMQLGHTWSLAVEEHFYLVWPFLFSTLFALHPKRLYLFTLLFILASPILGYVLLNYTSLEKIFFTYRWTFTAGYSIALGCLAAMVLQDEKLKNKSTRLLGSGFALCLGLLLWANSLVPFEVDVILGTFLRNLGFTLIVCWIFLNQASRLTKCLDVRPLRYLGTLSYGIYIYQGLFIMGGPHRAIGQAWPPGHTPPYWGIIFLIIVTPLSYHFFEKPLIKIGKKFRQKEKAPAREANN